jgi:hypothetical protein
MLSTYRLPLMNGPDLAARIREKLPGIAVLLMSDNPDHATACASCQPPFVCRPRSWDPAELAGAVAAMLAARNPDSL